jgi:hypothetical protein
MTDTITISKDEYKALTADAERYRWLREKDATVIKIENEKRGFRTTLPDAKWEKWYEFSGYSVSTMPLGTIELETMDQAIDEARNHHE